MELGPGPGTNFRCYSKSGKEGNDDQLQPITSWVGVDPNQGFSEVLQIEANKHDLQFPITTIWLNAESNTLDIARESIETVVGTHVLCSVDNVQEVLRNVKTSLNVGGAYVFMEHVYADAVEGSFLRKMQVMLQPVVGILANGCTFKDMEKEIRQAFSDDDDYSYVIEGLERFEAPMPFFVFTPHIMGRVVKKERIRM
jgi:hypothetical protein